ncbi:MAG: 50S ribosomal protein L25/general stress protein Ctc [Candidatus Alcyoniella australis]|nr:50S ribosomal protein L25/general stress protein Ctc [Candidatus Alcyoniella australis]
MNDRILNATRREAAGKGAARKLRNTGHVPAVIYGSKLKKASPLAIDSKQFIDLLRGGGQRALLKLVIEKDKELDGKTVIVKDMQVHPLTHRLLHIDLMEIRMDEKIQIEIPVQLNGKAMGLETGGVLQMGVRTIRVECLPANIPEQIEVDISSLDIGDSIHLEDIELPQGATSAEDSNPVLASVVVVRAVAEAAEGEEGAEGAEAAEGEKPAEATESKSKEEPKKEES